MEYNKTNFLLPDFDKIVLTDQNPILYFRTLVLEGLSSKIPNINEKYVNRLITELSYIIEKRFIEYFLILHDYVQFAKTENIKLGYGRGSSPSSLISFSLGITDVDPVEEGLIFERFINTNTIIPNIDLDIETDARQKIKNYLKTKYGNKSIADIVSFSRYSARSILQKSLCKHEVPFDLATKVCDLVPIFGVTLDDAIKKNNELKLHSEDTRFKDSFINAIELDGLVSNKLSHSSGVIISNKELTTTIPVEKRIDDDLLALVESRHLNKLKIVKFNLCEFNIITHIKLCEEGIMRKDPMFNSSKISFEDPLVFNYLLSADVNTESIFQIGYKAALVFYKVLTPETLNEIANYLGLFRPFNLEMGIADQYKINKNARTYSFPIEQLRDILNPTFGVIIFQEQILHILNQFYNFSMDEAVILLQEFKEQDNKSDLKLSNMLLASNTIFSKSENETVVAMIILSFRSSYSKSHAICYAKLTYISGYYSFHFPDEWKASGLKE